ncbi:STM3941 family protein [Chenggangzhangella methanolivorans]|uniref:PH domain-containing protein n=1 Tax=Chenggangzhangella methanolivorans TaxID=1437009 RepID=A0A9E6R5I1_9HYPH|nr:STM3941 family protein [Chenggangzhangella methanolivorans]QZN98243.1 hypothetical protein K6K41_13865 [Chenggangzhangella methanolivorans]
MAEDQIDLEKSALRLLALKGGAWGFVALCGVLLHLRPAGVEPGSLNEFTLYAGVLFFGACAIVATVRFFRRGPVVSVGRQGVFDRRLSNDWIPWDAVTAVGKADLGARKSIVLAIDPAREPALPFTKAARRLAKINAATVGVTGYWMSATELSGGFPALDAAIARFHPRSATS